MMTEAISKELQSYLNAGGAQVIASFLIPEGKQVLRARVVLTFKEICERGLATGSRKAKCRIVALGFEDERAVEHGLTTDAPTVSRVGGRVAAFIITCLGWTAWSGYGVSVPSP